MEDAKIKTDDFNFDNVKTKHYLPQNTQWVTFPDRCAYFMKLSIDDRVTVLKKLGWCYTCASPNHLGKSCRKQWDERPVAHPRCAFIYPDTKQCTRAWVICKSHKTENEGKSKTHSDRYGWIPLKNDQEEHVIMHFREETESVQADCPISVDLDLPVVPPITHHSVNINNDEINVEHPPTPTQKHSKILLSNSRLSL